MRVSKGHLLVVEDHRSTAMALKQFLETCGYSVDTADTVARGLSAATSRQYDLLVCDLNLPDGTGWDLLETLRRTSPVRAIAYSAFDDAEQIARSRSAGFLEHIAKGIDPDELLKIIGRAIQTPPGKEPPLGRPISSKANR
jgi:DNA-binding response OmpR family regulator